MTIETAGRRVPPITLSGHDIRLVQTVLGHSSPTTTAYYLGVRDDDLARASVLARIAA